MQYTRYYNTCNIRWYFHTNIWYNKRTWSRTRGASAYVLSCKLKQPSVNLVRDSISCQEVSHRDRLSSCDELRCVELRRVPSKVSRRTSQAPSVRFDSIRFGSVQSGSFPFSFPILIHFFDPRCFMSLIFPLSFYAPPPPPPPYGENAERIIETLAA